MNLKLMEVCQGVEYLPLEQLKKGLETSTYVSKYAYILHDKDTHEDGTPKAPHYHIMLKLKDSTDTKYIARDFGVKENYVGRIKGRWADALSYLTHKNRPERHQYDEKEVVSNFDFKEVIEKAAKSSAIESVMNGIASGTIKQYNIYDFIDVVAYARNKRLIDAAFTYRAKMLANKGDREMKCIYITGESGCGKSTYAKEICKDKGFSYFVSSGSNDVLDGYGGQDCIILDDLRPSCLGLSDLLKLLDNNTASSVKSRYYNKVLETRLIIITSVLPIDDFFHNVFETHNEPLIQFQRRCQLYIRMDKSLISSFMWDDLQRTYNYFGERENYILKRFNISSLSDSDKRAMLSEYLGSSSTEFKRNKAYEKVEPVYNGDSEEIKNLVQGLFGTNHKNDN